MADNHHRRPSAASFLAPVSATLALELPETNLSALDRLKPNVRGAW